MFKLSCLVLLLESCFMFMLKLTSPLHFPPALLIIYLPWFVSPASYHPCLPCLFSLWTPSSLCQFVFVLLCQAIFSSCVFDLCSIFWTLTFPVPCWICSLFPLITCVLKLFSVKTFFLGPYTPYQPCHKWNMINRLILICLMPLSWGWRCFFQFVWCCCDELVCPSWGQ